MNDYEIMLILDPALAEERANEVIARIRTAAEEAGGSWDGHEPWGRRKLAYEIAKGTEGVYHLLLFTTTPDALAEITRVLKITDGVTRHLAVRRVKDGFLKPPSPGLTGPAASATPAPEAAPVAEAASAPEAASEPAEPEPAQPETDQPETDQPETAEAEPEPAAEPVAAAAAAPSAAADDDGEAAE